MKNLKKMELDPCAKCKGNNFGKEKVYQDFKDKETGEIKEVHTGYLRYCRDCVNRSMKAMKYKEKLWVSLHKNLASIEEIEGKEEMEKFRKFFQDRIKDFPNYINYKKKNDTDSKIQI